jgi:DNA repair exonuclease SbcCD nuclease subunit
MTDLPAIRIAHFADTHLGYRAMSKLDPETERNQRSVDFERAFEATIDAILESKPDLVLHAGDVFHHTRPTWHAMRVFIRQMRRIERAGIPAVIIAGNHDTPRMRTSGTAFSVLELALPEIEFVTEYDVERKRFEKLGVTVHAVPHGALSLSSYEPSAYAEKGMRNILLTHGMIPGMSDFARYEPGTEEITDSLIDTSFSYIALGHYHEFHRARANAWYSGSTERTGWGDERAEPGFVLLDFHNNELNPADPEHSSIPTRVMKTLAAINGEGLPAREIANIILKRADAVGDPTAMTRVELKDVTRATRREVEHLVRRELDGRVWSLDCYTRGDLIANIGERVPLDGAITDVQTLFGEFVDERTTQGVYDLGFSDAFRLRGMAAINMAQEQVNLAMAEDDK